MKNRIEAAIWDVDGTVLNTRGFILGAYEHSLRINGHAAVPREAMSPLIGRPLGFCYEQLAPQGDFIALSQAHRDFQAENMGLITAYEDLAETLGALSAEGIQLGAFSSRAGKLVDSLQNAGVLDMFGVVVQGSDVTRHKPDPEGFLMATQSLGVDPSRTAMIGDADVDILAGKAGGAGMTIAITHGFGLREALLATEPDHIVDRLRDIPPILLGSVAMR